MTDPAPFDDRVRRALVPLEAKLAPIAPWDDGFAASLARLCDDRMSFGRGQRLIGAGEAYRCIYLIEEGWAQRSKRLPGGLRQIVNFAIASDFLCFNAALFARSDHDVIAKTELSVFTLQIEPFVSILRDKPQIALALAWANAHEEAMLAERVASLGRRDARQRVAHLFCELWVRLRRVGLASRQGFAMPVTQEDIADALGLSLVHVNRTLRGLRADGIVRFRHGRAEVEDLDGLQRAAGFDGGYLDVFGSGGDDAAAAI
jgi:CRP-like cAMP-binding protein